ncbi:MULTISPECIES: hypothetical protein [unclassified Streptomyces]|uniref:hypothetical protein n=1 Tax=unclassified Streptomyces TaxID=2593676 RepID=UPI001EF9656C|nr:MULTISPECIES: hypothetical protein [unclassified Streptomyces]
MSRSGRWLIIGATATALALVPGTAFAGKDPGGGSRGETTTGGDRDGQMLTSRISYSGSTGGSGGKNPKTFTPTGNWTPPACWFEPMSASEFAAAEKASYDTVVNNPGQPSYAKNAMAELRKKYTETDYKDYNLDKEGQGAFWVAVMNQDRLNELAAFACNSTLPEWVPNGTPPPMRQAVTPQVLAELAYNRIIVPTTQVTLAPEANTKVNLPTWAWLDKGIFKPVSVTASLNAAGVNVSATTTATPVSLRIKPGTADAQLHPASGECTFNADGSIGTPFTQGSADKTPPCGLTYLRASGNGGYSLEASITWNVSWVGTNSPRPTNMPPGTFTTVQNITVQEIQAVNR